MKVPFAAIVAIEDDATETADSEIGATIVVVVTDRCAHGPAGIAYAGLVSDIGKGTVVIVAIEDAACLLSGESHRYAGGVGEVDVQPTIAVVVEESNASAHGFDDVLLIGTGEMLEADLCRGGDVDELRDAAGRG